MYIGHLDGQMTLISIAAHHIEHDDNTFLTFDVSFHSSRMNVEMNIRFGKQR
jgi:hypothetical protein